MNHKIIVEDFGKIRHAELEVLPLTLLVGDNNSGKSYLLSLLWGLGQTNLSSVLLEDSTIKEMDEYKEIQNVFSDIWQPSTDRKNTSAIPVKKLVPVINELFSANKDEFISSIFNYRDMSIGKVEIQYDGDESVHIDSSAYASIRYRFHDSGSGVMLNADPSKAEALPSFVIQDLLALVIRELSGMTGAVYLPAARTGFMLAKDVINKMGRQKAFGLISNGQNDIQEMQPFTTPIIDFLDVMDTLRADGSRSDKNLELLRWIETNMSKGKIAFTDADTKDINYQPDGSGKNIPLRASSAVVTELAPLELLLKYKVRIPGLCYEEPEMCLHPGLQLQMARLLVKLVNSGISIAVTTHSDIILQHVNNMCRINRLGQADELLGSLGYTGDDIMDVGKVAVYQLTDHGTYTEVDRLLPTENGFEIPTFSKALMDILNQSMMIQEYGEQEE